MELSGDSSVVEARCKSSDPGRNEKRAGRTETNRSSHQMDAFLFLPTLSGESLYRTLIFREALNLLLSHAKPKPASLKRAQTSGRAPPGPEIGGFGAVTSPLSAARSGTTPTFTTKAHGKLQRIAQCQCTTQQPVACTGASIPGLTRLANCPVQALLHVLRVTC